MSLEDDTLAAQERGDIPDASVGYRFDISGRLNQLNKEEWDAAGDEGYVVIFDYGTTADDKPYWLYLAAKPSKYKEFLRQTIRRVAIRYKEYGQILRYGFGKEVPANIRQEMKQKYGGDMRYERWLKQEIQKIRQDVRKEKRKQDASRIHGFVDMLKAKKEQN